MNKLIYLALCFIIPLQALYYGELDAEGVPLDCKMLKYLDQREGFFVEVGAHNGITQSNTKFLEEHCGWTGILIEPSSSLFNELVRNRPHSRCFQCVLGSMEQNNTYIEGDFNGATMASVGGTRLRRHTATYRVQARSLQSILDEVHIEHVHFFSLDVEGYELNVLKGIDFERTFFDYILVEIYAEEYEVICNFLKQRGYVLIENVSSYNHKTNPRWDGTHNDYLFKRLTVEASSETD